MNTRYDIKKITDEIRALGLNNGADLVGFTSAKEFEEGSPEGHKPSFLMSNAMSIITVACGRQLNEDRNYSYDWGPQYSKVFIKLKDGIAPLRTESRKSVDVIKKYLSNKGFAHVSEMHGWSGILSFKMAAYLSGLGVIGKGSLIVNPKLGPLNILTCIVTDVILEYGSPMSVDVCRSCTKCIIACKYAAFKRKDDGYIWMAEKCRCYDLIMNPVNLKWTYGPCNSECANACPIGK